MKEVGVSAGARARAGEGKLQAVSPPPCSPKALPKVRNSKPVYLRGT